MYKFMQDKHQMQHHIHNCLFVPSHYFSFEFLLRSNFLNILHVLDKRYVLFFSENYPTFPFLALMDIYSESSLNILDSYSSTSSSTVSTMPSQLVSGAVLKKDEH